MRFIEIIRANVCILMVFAVIVGALVGGVSSYKQIFLAGLAVFFLAAAGNVSNDYFDYKIDKINKPGRAIPSGRISRKSALIYFLILFGLGLGICLAFLNVYLILLAFFNSGLVLLYNWKLKRTAIGHFVDTWLAAAGFLFGSLISLEITFPVWILFIMGYMGNLGREVTKGIEDMKGDRKEGGRTLAIAIGERGARYFAAACVLTALAISFLPYYYGFLGMYYIFGMVIFGIVFLYSVSLIFRDAAKAQKAMKIGMFLVMLAFLAGLL